MEVLRRLGCELRPGFDSLLARQQRLKVCRAELSNLVVRDETLMRTMDDTFADLFADAKSSPRWCRSGSEKFWAKTLPWGSLTIDKFVEDLGARIAVLEEAVNKVNGLRICSINKSITEIAETLLLPTFKEAIIPHMNAGQSGPAARFPKSLPSLARL
jgi:hypothetical protein